MLVSKRRVILGVVLTFSLVISSASFAGVHFVELPESVTDEMMLNQTPELKSQLFELINEAVKGSVDEIKTIIFTHDGEPWYKNIDPALMGDLTTATKTETKDDIPVNNDVTFNLTEESGTIAWTTLQRGDVDHFLNHAVSDDNLETGIYNVSKKLYGQPFFSYTVDVFLDPGIEGSAIWIPPIIYYAGSDFIVYGGDLYLKNWPYPGNPNIHDDDNRAILAKAMLMLFWGGFTTDYDQFLDGMSQSGGTTMMSHFSNAYPNYVEIYHGERPDLNEYRPGFIFYDNYNNQAIATGGYNFADGNHSAELAAIRYQMANMAWFKAYTAGLDQGFQFYQEFNKVLYAYGLSFHHLVGGFWYEQPTFDELADMARDAWNSHGTILGPEGYANFNNWREEQYILTEQRLLLPQFGVFCDHNKLRCQIYFPMFDGECNYIEEPPHEDISVQVKMLKPSGQVLYSATHTALANNGYFEVNIPQLPTLTRIDCSCEILYEPRQYFEEPKKTTFVINTGGPSVTNNQVMGVLPSIRQTPDHWDIEDPNGTMRLLNVQNYAFIFDTSVMGGIAGEYKIFRNDALEATFVKDKKSFMTNLCWAPEEELEDKNGNQIPDKYEEELAEKLCPDVYVHDASIIYWPHTVETMLYYGLLFDDSDNYHKPQDPYGPDYVKPEDWYCQNMGDLFKKYCDEWNGDWHLYFSPCPYDDYWDWTHLETLWHDFYLDPWHGISTPDFGKKVLYYNFGYDESFRPFIQYWFFYPFDHTGFEWGCHQGDWELVNVIISNLNPFIASPEAIVYFFHEHYLPVTVSSPNGFWQIYEETHPIVRVGGTMHLKNDASGGVEITDEQDYPSNDYGMHCTGASYPRDGWYYGVGWGGTDESVYTTEDEDQHTYPEEFELVALEPTEGNPPYWTYFPGKWGGDGGSPKGPTFHGRWKKLYGDPSVDTLWSIVYNPNPPDNGEVATKLNDDKQENKKQKISLSSEKHIALLACEKLLPSSDSSLTIDLYEHSKELASSELKPDVGSPFDSNSERHTIESGTSPKAMGLDVDSSTTNSPYKPTTLTNDTVTITDNPATTQTTIKLGDSLTDGNPAVICIYDISGRLIKKVETDSDYTWDLVSDSGGSVSSGIYIICVQTTTQEIVGKLAVVR